MTRDERGRWYRVYARQIEDHPKFRSLTGLELGAWTALRSAAELRDRAIIADRDEAVLILKRRKIPRPAHMLDRLLTLVLFDLDDDGRITVHDREDHDRPETEQQNHRRDHRRSEPTEGCTFCLVEGWDRSAGRGGAWSPRGEPVEDGDPPVERGLEAEPAPAHSQQPQPADATPGPPVDESDSATIACRTFGDSGRWLSNGEYTSAWDDLDRRYSPEWVQEAIDPAYQELAADNPRVKPWDFLRSTERRLAERARAEERRRKRAEADRKRREAEAIEQAQRELSPEERERQELQRRAIHLWQQRGGTIPEDPAELEQWVAQQEGHAA